MRIGFFCSGGDAPGMNACLRTVVRAAFAAGHEVVGIRRGYQGILDEDFVRNERGQDIMTPRDVSQIVQHGGTMLRSSRCPAFVQDAGQQQAAANLRKHRIDALIPCGGDGTIRGAVALARWWDGRIVGTPGTIDNDLLGTDFTIGFHTAVNTAVEAVDKLRDTAESHERMFIVEVMGRHSGYIALYTALAAGAEVVCIPETTTDVNVIFAKLKTLKERDKHSITLVVAEGDDSGGAVVLERRLQEAGCPFPMKAIILGHLQRGGSPVPADRLLASRLGAHAVRAILDGKTGVMAGEVAGKLTLTPFAETYSGHKAVPEDYVALLDTLAQ